MKNLNPILFVLVTLLTVGCGDMLLGGGGGSSNPEMEDRKAFERQAQSVRLVMGQVLMASEEDEAQLVEMAWGLDGYTRVTCEIEGVTWDHCYTTSSRCGGGSFPTACFTAVGGMKACRRGSLAQDCVATTLDGAGLNGAPLEVIYCGLDAPKGRPLAGYVTCE